uniref:Uncharacterized protein n=1 Tax=Fagus sylvatica TaxID=28930 RepID=A0A2N9EQW5_FAGSY
MSHMRGRASCSVLWLSNRSIWRIGNGQGAKIWSNNWIPATATTTPTDKITSPSQLMDEDTTVVVLLIDIEPRGWQTKIIELPHEVSMIKSISLKLMKIMKNQIRQLCSSCKAAV